MTSDLVRNPAREARLRAIDFRLTFLGELKRRELSQTLKIGGASVTRDIAIYKDQLGAAIELDASTKAYRPSAGFKPLFDHDVELVLRTLTRGFGAVGGTKPSSEPLLPAAFPRPICLPKLDVLAKFSRAIHLKYPLRLRYHSFTSGAQERVVVPLAFADNGLRWHCRVYDRRRSAFIDLVPTRVEAIEELRNELLARHEQLANDVEWNRTVELELVPHPKETRPDVIAMDYPMQDGVFRVQVRAALASYLLRQWIVDCSSEHRATGTEFRLWLRNTPVLYGVANSHLAPEYDGPQTYSGAA